MSLLTRSAPWFAFLTHPRSIEDLLAHGAGPLLRDFSNNEAEFVAKACSLPPIVVGEVVFGFSPIHGEVICVMRMPEDLMSPSGKQAIVEGVSLAIRRGARVISLGALTAPATGGGQRLLRMLPSGVTLTNGNAYTAAVVMRNVEEASIATALGRKACVAVVGCTGAVGVAATHLLARAGFDLILVGRCGDRVRHQFKNLDGHSVMTGDLEAVRAGNIIVLLTNDPAAQLNRDHVQDGTVVIDCAQPPNIPASAYEEFRQRGVEVVKGGLARIPGYACTFNFRLPNRADTFACLTEAYLFAREGIREHSVGKPSAEKALMLERVAHRHSVFPTPLNLNQDLCHATPACAEAREA